MAGHDALIYRNGRLSPDGQGEIALIPNEFGRVQNAHAGLHAREREVTDEVTARLSQGLPIEDAIRLLEAHFGTVRREHLEVTHSLHYAGFPPAR